MDALDGLEDLPTQPQCGADAECAPVHAAPQVRQVPTLARTEDTLANTTQTTFMRALPPVTSVLFFNFSG